MSRVRWWWDRRVVRRAALSALIRRTGNFTGVKWLGRPVWQNLADIWTVQETLVEREVDMVVECGTNRGGSAFFMASVLDLLGRGRVLTIDVVDQAGVDHPRIEFLIGSSTDPDVVAEVHRRVAEHSPGHVLVLLDSDHSEEHVLQELRAYNDLVGVGDYIVVQDGVIDELRMLRADRPGPLMESTLPIFRSVPRGTEGHFLWLLSARLRHGRWFESCR